MENQYFTNRDLNLSAVLTTLGFPVDRVDKSDPRRVVFYFLRSIELENTIRRYWEDKLLCNPRLLLTNLKVLKGRIYAEE